MFKPFKILITLSCFWAVKWIIFLLILFFLGSCSAKHCAFVVGKPDPTSQKIIQLKKVCE